MRINQTIDAEKFLISGMWSVNCIQDGVDVPKGQSCNAAFFCDGVMPKVIDDILSRS
jgi:hypothetical protein